MTRKSWLWAGAAALIFIAFPAIAGQDAPPRYSDAQPNIWPDEPPPPPEAEPPQPTPKRVQIVTDQTAGAVRIFIDGREQAIIDSTGLHVRGNVAYGGTAMDTGPDGFDAAAKDIEDRSRADAR